MAYTALRISNVLRQSYLVIQRESQDSFVLLYGADPVWEQLPNTCPVPGQAEDTHSTGTAVPSGSVAGMGRNAPPLDDLPDPGLVPVDNAAPLVNQPVGPGGRICAVDLHLVVFGASSALLPAFSRDNKQLCVRCSILNVGIQLILHLCFERTGAPPSLMASGFCRKLHTLTVRPKTVHTADQGVCHLALEVGTAVTSTGDTSFCGKPS